MHNYVASDIGKSRFWLRLLVFIWERNEFTFPLIDDYDDLKFYPKNNRSS